MTSKLTSISILPYFDSSNCLSPVNSNILITLEGRPSFDGFVDPRTFDEINNVENVMGSQYGDVIIGSNLVNTIRGGEGDDNIGGLGGDDILFGGAGADNLNGGDGIDTAFYNFSLEPVTINLLTGISTGGEAEGDRLQEIEIIVGSNQNDTLIGDDTNNVLNGFGGQDSLVGNGGDDELIGSDGDDILEGGSGNDTINGGFGNDTVSFQSTESNSNFGVFVQLDNLNTTADLDGSSSGASSDNDLINNVENVIGSQYDDRIQGSNSANTLRGEEGGDFIEGRDGDDILFGGADADSLIGGAGDDELYGEDGNDTLIGGAGDDELYGEDGNDTLIGKEGSDTLRGGAGDDTYQLSASNFAGVTIKDLEGNDTLNLENANLALSQPSNSIIGLQRDNTNLVIDINQDGIINSYNDITILDFFDELGTGAGDGFMENISNLLGTNVLNFLANKPINNPPGAVEDQAITIDFDA